MAQFRGGVQGNRSEATRLGHKATGLRVFANGWHCGVKVYASHQDGKDVFEVYKTGGSMNSNGEKIATITE